MDRQAYLRMLNEFAFPRATAINLNKQYFRKDCFEDSGGQRQRSSSSPDYNQPSPKRRFLNVRVTISLTGFNLLGFFYVGIS